VGKPPGMEPTALTVAIGGINRAGYLMKPKVLFEIQHKP
jgi:hypothetical protein